MIEVLPLGAGQDVGRSCIIISIANKRIMFDCGMHMGYHDERRFPDFSLVHPDTLDLVIISHFHLDHCGALPFLTGVVGYGGPVVMTAPTKTIAPLLLEDYRKIVTERRVTTEKGSFFTNSMINECMRQVVVAEVERPLDINGVMITAFYAGHVLGAAMYMIQVGPFSCVYTGDYNMTPDRHLGAARLNLPVKGQRVDLLITESTYATTTRESKRSRERDFLRAIHKCVMAGGKVLIPTFALGRAQELCLLLDNYWTRMGLDTADPPIPIYFSAGLAEKANDYYGLHLEWTNESVQRPTSNDHNPFSFKNIRVFQRQFADLPGPMVLFSTPGMLHSGQSLHVFCKWAADPRNLLIIPGYCVAGTVGAKVLAGQKRIMVDLSSDTQSPVPVDVNIQVKNLSFSAHADSKGILQLIKQCQPRHVMLVHGERQKMAVLRKQIENEYKDIHCHDPANGQYVYISPNWNMSITNTPDLDEKISSIRRDIYEAAKIVLACPNIDITEKRRLLRLSQQAQSSDHWSMMVRFESFLVKEKMELRCDPPYEIIKQFTCPDKQVDLAALQLHLIFKFHPFVPVQLSEEGVELRARTVKCRSDSDTTFSLCWQEWQDQDIADSVFEYCKLINS